MQALERLGNRESLALKCAVNLKLTVQFTKPRAGMVSG